MKSFSMQKHCIDICKSAIDFLNPGQVIVDVSDQPIYAISRRLQQLLPHELGPGMYVPMFGGLHIEKLLLEIHGQIVDGSGLSELLGISKLSIAGAGNLLINVPQITTARYLVEVYLCAEFKAMKIVFDSSGSLHDIEQ